MDALLEGSGFRVRERRADCMHCAGGSRLTVSFTDQVAYCHRCRWTANAFTLAKQLGLLTENSAAAASFRAERLERARFRVEIEAFEKWLDATYWRVAGEYRQLAQAAQQAKSQLTKNPNDEAAWEALANFYHREARISATLDYLSLARASQWLESDARPEGVFKAWRENVVA